MWGQGLPCGGAERLCLKCRGQVWRWTVSPGRPRTRAPGELRTHDSPRSGVGGCCLREGGRSGGLGRPTRSEGPVSIPAWVWAPGLRLHQAASESKQALSNPNVMVPHQACPEPEPGDTREEMEPGSPGRRREAPGLPGRLHTAVRVTCLGLRARARTCVYWPLILKPDQIYRKLDLPLGRPTLRISH